MGHYPGKERLTSDLAVRDNMGNFGEWASPTSSCSVHENTSVYGEATSSSANSSMHEQNLENDRMIAQALSEEFSAADNQIGRRLTHLSSIPHLPRVNRNIPTINDATLDHQRLLERLHHYGLLELRMIGDGNCQFRALSHQLYQTSEYHKFVRKQIVHQLKSHRDLYESYVPMKYGEYLKKMKRSGEWGDHVTLQAAADHFGVRICLITSFRETCFIEITSKQPKSKGDLFLSFWSEVHYNSIYAAAASPYPAVVKRKKKHWLF